MCFLIKKVSIKIIYGSVHLKSILKINLNVYDYIEIEFFDSRLKDIFFCFK